MSERHFPGIAILASGSGSTAEAFIHATQDGRVDAEVGLVICNNPPEKAGIYDRITRLNSRYGLDIETVKINGFTHPEGKVERGQTLAESAAIYEKIRIGRYAHVALMGYMKVINGDLMEGFGWHPRFSSIFQARMSNTHPGPLPETTDLYGIGASERVLQLGMPQSRHTMHLVAPGVDTGPLLAEHPVDVLPDDTAQTLFDRVQIVEKATISYVIGNFLREQEAYVRNS